MRIKNKNNDLKKMSKTDAKFVTTLYMTGKIFDIMRQLDKPYSGNVCLAQNSLREHATCFQHLIS